MPALFFGSISTLADTSELQRQAFNDAFAQHGLHWRWERDHYRDLLRGNGGEARVAAFARERGEQVDAAAVHASKSARFRDLLASGGIAARPGVADAIRDALAAGWVVGLVTTTSSDNVRTLLAALEPDVRADALAVVVDASRVSSPKPDPEAYRRALSATGLEAPDCVAIEDNAGGVAAAIAAGITCLAFPNENTTAHDFGSVRRITRVDFRDLGPLVSATV